MEMQQDVNSVRNAMNGIHTRLWNGHTKLKIAKVNETKV